MPLDRETKLEAAGVVWHSLSLARVQQLLNPKDPYYSAQGLPTWQRKDPSRLVLWHAYQACHPSDGASCALQRMKPFAILSKPVRMAGTVELYRKLTGDESTPSKALIEEANVIARKCRAAPRTPSAALRRWIRDMPLACQPQGPWCEEHKQWKHCCGCLNNHPSVTNAFGRDALAARGSGASSLHGPGPGSYHTSSSDMGKVSQREARPTSVFISPSHRARVRSPRRPSSRAQTPSRQGRNRKSGPRAPVCTPPSKRAATWLIAGRGRR